MNINTITNTKRYNIFFVLQWQNILTFQLDSIKKRFLFEENQHLLFFDDGQHGVFDLIGSEQEETDIRFQGRQTNWSCVFYYGHGTVSLILQSKGWLLQAGLCVGKCVFNTFTSIYPFTQSWDAMALETFYFTSKWEGSATWCQRRFQLALELKQEQSVR